MKKFRLLRVLEYTGTLEFIQEHIRNRGVKGSSPVGWNRNQGKIVEAFIGALPDELEPASLAKCQLPDDNRQLKLWEMSV